MTMIFQKIIRLAAICVLNACSSEPSAVPQQGIAAPTLGISMPAQGVGAPKQGIAAPQKGNKPADAP